MAVDATLFKAGMRRLAAGVSVITTAHAGEKFGLTATAVCSVSVAPPTLLCCINRSASAHDAVRESGIVAINLLAVADAEVADRFGGAELPELRFATGPWTTLVTGAPVLETALVSFDCRVSQMVDAGTHTVILAEVMGVRVAEAGDPLMYHLGDYGSFRALADALSNS